eukprot:m.83896 g.83896  ORF g.83896 m.83896 type:complete len:408 (+) comp11250_c0_seq2:29-1252(+)
MRLNYWHLRPSAAQMRLVSGGGSGWAQQTEALATKGSPHREKHPLLHRHLDRRRHNPTSDLRANPLVERTEPLLPQQMVHLGHGRRRPLRGPQVERDPPRRVGFLARLRFGLEHGLHPSRGEADEGGDPASDRAEDKRLRCPQHHTPFPSPPEHHRLDLLKNGKLDRGLEGEDPKSAPASVQPANPALGHDALQCCHQPSVLPGLDPHKHPLEGQRDPKVSKLGCVAHSEVCPDGQLPRRAEHRPDVPRPEHRVGVKVPKLLEDGVQGGHRDPVVETRESVCAANLCDGVSHRHVLIRRLHPVLGDLHGVEQKCRRQAPNRRRRRLCYVLHSPSSIREVDKRNDQRTLHFKWWIRQSPAPVVPCPAALATVLRRPRPSATPLFTVVTSNVGKVRGRGGNNTQPQRVA